MSTLRDRLIAIAAPCTCVGDYVRRNRIDPTCRHHDEVDAVLAAARMALEEALRINETGAQTWRSCRARIVRLLEGVKR